MVSCAIIYVCSQCVSLNFEITQPSVYGGRDIYAVSQRLGKFLQIGIESIESVIGGKRCLQFFGEIIFVCHRKVHAVLMIVIVHEHSALVAARVMKVMEVVV